MDPIYQIDPGFQVLTLLYNLSAVDKSSAKPVEELERFSKMDKSEIADVLRKLAEDGYVSAIDNSFYLTNLGVVVVRSLFT
jgi:predicted transcriptional regulator